MNPKHSFLVLSLLLSLSVFSGFRAQNWPSGFDPVAFLRYTSLNQAFGDTIDTLKLGREIDGYVCEYLSEPLALDYCWAKWMHELHVPVLAVRGTIQTRKSWLANGFAGMFPARDTIRNIDEIWPYCFAEHPEARVHAGWAIGSVLLSHDMLPHILEIAKTGKREIVLTGHSQGGALVWLLSMQFYFWQQQGILPSDLKFTVYTIGSPKPGNLWFAREFLTKYPPERAFNVFSNPDVVPLLPPTLQYIDPEAEGYGFHTGRKDFTDDNHSAIYSSLFSRARKFQRPLRKAAKKYHFILGNFAGVTVHRYLDSYQWPKTISDFNYHHVGTPVMLVPDADYLAFFNADSANSIFAHHSLSSYRWFFEKHPFNRLAASGNRQWNLVEMSENPDEPEVYSDVRLRIDPEHYGITLSDSCSKHHFTYHSAGKELHIYAGNPLVRFTCNHKHMHQILSKFSGPVVLEENMKGGLSFIFPDKGYLLWRLDQ